MVHCKLLAGTDEGAWYNLLALDGVPLQTNGMAEVTSHTMQQLLQIHTTTDGWVATLPFVAMMINAMLQRQMGMMPHKVAYRRKLRLPMNITPTLMTVPATKVYVTRMQCIWECI